MGARVVSKQNTNDEGTTGLRHIYQFRVTAHTRVGMPLRLVSLKKKQFTICFASYA